MADDHFALPGGHNLDDHEIRELLGVGALGIKYVAFDRNLGKSVVIKEYLPDQLATRTGTGIVPRSSAHRTDFEAGLNQFLEEGEALTRIAHPNLAHVLRCLRANGTGYIVRDFVEGETLSALLEQKAALSEEECTSLLFPILDGLEALHRANFLHRDIGPDKILIREDGAPVLLGFPQRQQVTAARQVFRATSRSSPVTLRPGYAALEQYSQMGHLGPWTDVYGLAGVMYRCATGLTPPEAIQRALRDEMLPVSEATQEPYRARVLAGIDAALKIRAPERPQNVAAWRRSFALPDQSARGVRQAARGQMFAPKPLDPDPFAAPARPTRSLSPRMPTTPESRRPWAVPAIAATALVAVLTWVDTGVLRSSGIARDASARLLAPDESQPEVSRQESPDEPAQSIPQPVSETPRTTSAPSTPAPSSELPSQEDLTPAPSIELPSQEDLTPANPTEQRYASPTRSTPVVDTTPPGAEVLSAGEMVDQTPLGTPSGTPSKVPDLSGTLERSIAYGTLTLELTPDDAEVTLPDLGEAYEAGMRVPEGRLSVRVGRDGYMPQTRTIEVAGVTRSRISLTRNPQPFTVSTTPEGAFVTFPYRDQAYSPGVMLTPGEYRVRAVLPGHETWEGAVSHHSRPTNHAVTLQTGASEFADPLASGGIGPTMVAVPAGSFRMGCVSRVDCRSNELPVHAVTLAKPLALSKFEVTCADFGRFTRDTAREQTRQPSSCDEDSSLPVVNVTWDDAVAYAEWLSSETQKPYRLPSEAEWEYAARADTKTRYSWGNSVGVERANCYGCRSRANRDQRGTVAVGSFRANPWGLHDMHGNAWEWVSDCRLDDYQGATGDGSSRTAPNCEERVLRGGSWRVNSSLVRAAQRGWGKEALRLDDVGIRVVVEMAP